jgi:hypothetical protein
MMSHLHGGDVSFSVQCVGATDLSSGCELHRIFAVFTDIA